MMKVESEIDKSQNLYFRADDSIRRAQVSHGLVAVYKGQVSASFFAAAAEASGDAATMLNPSAHRPGPVSYTHLTMSTTNTV